MSCIYPPSDVFKIAEVTQPGQSSDGSQSPYGNVKVEFVGVSECYSAYFNLAVHLNQDAMVAYNRKTFGHDMPVLILLCHPEEFDHPELNISPYAKPFVEVRDVSTGAPLLYNYNLYVTDPALLGIFEGVPLPANLLSVNKIVAMRKS